MKTLAMALTGISLAALLAGCNDNTAPVATNAVQTNQPAVDRPAPADPAAAPDVNKQATNVAPAPQAPRATQTRRPANSARQATRNLGAGVRAHVDVFYDELERFGTWARHPDFSYVWLPARQGHGWRPYQEGRWIWTDEYGWYWESSEPFAWAVYHYGRWDYDPEFGWFWVPGDTWAPAWVAWRHGGGRTGWAPIAPDRRGYAAGIPHRLSPPVLESWVFVEDRNFIEPHLGQYVVSIRQIGAMLDAAPDLAGPVYDNGVVINRGLRRQEIERATGRRVETREIVYVGHEGDVFEDVRAARLGIYRPMIEGVEIHQPPRVTVRDVTRVDRVMIREYASARIPGMPSVALLAVLDDQERRSLQDDRLSQEEAALDRKIEWLKQERSALLEERRHEADRLQVQIEQERQEASRQRMREQQHLLEQRRQRAESIGAIDVEPGSTEKQEVSPPASARSPAQTPRAVTAPEDAATRHAPPTSSPATAVAPTPVVQDPPPAPRVGPPRSATAPAAQPAERSPPAVGATTSTAKPVEPVPSPAPATSLQAPPRSAITPPAEQASPPAGVIAPAAKPVEHVRPAAPSISPERPPRSVAAPASPPAAERTSPASNAAPHAAPTAPAAPAAPTSQHSPAAEANAQRPGPQPAAPPSDAKDGSEEPQKETAKP